MRPIIAAVPAQHDDTMQKEGAAVGLGKGLAWVRDGMEKDDSLTRMVGSLYSKRRSLVGRTLEKPPCGRHQNQH